jgi:hypothetical protein
MRNEKKKVSKRRKGYEQGVPEESCLFASLFSQDIDSTAVLISRTLLE